MSKLSDCQNLAILNVESDWNAVNEHIPESLCWFIRPSTQDQQNGNSSSKSIGSGSRRAF